MLVVRAVTGNRTGIFKLVLLFDSQTDLRFRDMYVKITGKASSNNGGSHGRRLLFMNVERREGV